MIAEILDAFAVLDEVPIDQFFRLDNLFRRETGDGFEPRTLPSPACSFYRPGGLLGGAPIRGSRGLGRGLASRFLHFGQRVFKRLDQPLRVSLEALLRHPYRVSPRQRLQRLRQRGGARHLGLLHEHRDDALPEPQPRLDLDPNEILRVL